MEIDKLPPEVAEAIAALDAMTYAGSRTHAHWSCVKDHLHRLAEENARLREYEQAAGRFAIEKAELRRERDALKARITEARRVMLGTYPAHGSGYVQIVCDPAKGIGDETFALLKLKDGERE